jgi:histone H2A
VKLKDETTNLRKIESGVPQGSVLGPVLYVIYTSDLPMSDNITAATFADDATILVTHEEQVIASVKLQDISKINEWAKKWRIKVNQTNPRTLYSPCANKPARQCKWALLLYHKDTK